MGPEADQRWAPHPVYEFYDVSDRGRVRTWRNRQHGRRREPLPLKVKMLRTGYLCVKISHDGRSLHPLVHRMVLETFTGPCPEGMQACHANGLRQDNRLENLRWDTPRGNYQDRVRHGTVSRHNATFTDDQVLTIRALVAGGIPQAEVARHFGVSKTTVSHMISGKTYAHVSGVSSR